MRGSFSINFFIQEALKALFQKTYNSQPVQILSTINSIWLAPLI